jgi:creatinine deaminase
VNQELLHKYANPGLTKLSQHPNQDKIFRIARENARLSQDYGDDPAGAVLVKEGEVIAHSRNRVRELNDPIAVAEMDCIRQAGRRNDHKSLSLFTTRYPDMLVAGTLVQFSVGRLVVGLSESSGDVIEFLGKNNVVVEFLEFTDEPTDEQ